MSKSLRTERVEMRKALKLATDALAFYADPSVHMVRLSNPLKTSVAALDGGLLARMTLNDLTWYLDNDTWLALDRARLAAGDDD